MPQDWRARTVRMCPIKPSALALAKSGQTVMFAGSCNG